MNFRRLYTGALLALSLITAGCGTGVSQLPEIWDRADPFATGHMEMQIKAAIFCEMRRGALLARQLNSIDNNYNGKDVTAADDLPFPDNWGAQITLTLTADEKTTLTPTASFKTPLVPVIAHLQSISQSFALNAGGTLSSQNVRYDKFDFYYTASDLINNAAPSDICGTPPTTLLGPPSSSSPFVDGSQLGIADWLPGAIAVSIFQRSSRAAKNGEGPPLGTAGSFASDSATYDNKFVIVSSGNVTPSWNLVRIGTGTSPFFDLNRTRTHELLITVGPGATEQKKDKATGKIVRKNIGPSSSAVNSHFASQIGSAVAAAIRGQ
jgi:hypothetical protein